MFQNNPLLAQLKQQIHESKPKVEGIVKSTDKAFGFLEVDSKTSYFLPPPAMKKVLHGDKITATIETVNDKQQAEPDSLIEPSLSRFIAKIRFNKDNKLQVIPDHLHIKQAIGAKKAKALKNTELQAGDWVVANLLTHPLRDDRFLYVEVTEFICHENDEFSPWWVTLAKHDQSRYPVEGQDSYPMIDKSERADLTHIHFVTIDSESTEDMDDALNVEKIFDSRGSQVGWKLFVAIADPTAYIANDSDIERAARQRCFTNYLPGFNIPMLPRELADDLCSLTPFDTKAALVGEIETDLEGNLLGDIRFQVANVQSKARLAYNKVSDYLDNVDNAWQPEDEVTKEQIDLLHQFTLARIQWREKNALTFKESGDYSFELAEDGKVKAIHLTHRRIANRIVEEAMILANACAGKFLGEKIGTGIFNTHAGFDQKFLQPAQQFLFRHLGETEELKARYSLDTLETLNGYCQMQRDLDQCEERQQDYLNLRLRRFLNFAEFKSELAPHFGLGIEAYATWTSPIRKYSDMVNHRLIKAFLHNEATEKPSDDILNRLQEARRQNRLVERDIADWLYCRYLAETVANKPEFAGMIRDVSRGGLRVELTDIGASVFVPASTIAASKEDYRADLDDIALFIKEERRYQLGDSVQVRLTEVREETRTLVGELVI